LARSELQLPSAEPAPSPAWWRLGGRVQLARAGALRCVGVADVAHVGALFEVELGSPGDRTGRQRFGQHGTLLGEVTAFDESGAWLVPYGPVEGIRADHRWLGRVVGPMAEPLDGCGPLPRSEREHRLQAAPLPAFERSRLGPRFRLGVRALDLFTPCREGQRLGIFAGSGVGKSTLMSMIAAQSEADALVVGLIGERGREVREFLEETLDAPARARSIIVVATSDQPAMLRRRAAHLAVAIAEALRDEGLHVVCLLDSVTRYAMALREIGLASGEVPTSRGYTPNVFSELPRLLERCGPGRGPGQITGLFTVLVDGDDLDEPVSDAVRGILDGHVVLDRRIAERGRFPAVDVLRSVSRSTPGCYDPIERNLVARARQLMRAYEDMAELIRLGAYRVGSDPLIDEAIARHEPLESLLAQAPEERHEPGDDLAALARALGTDLDLEAVP
jgi:flagellum-specific ATP synthase